MTPLYGSFFKPSKKIIPSYTILTSPTPSAGLRLNSVRCGDGILAAWISKLASSSCCLDQLQLLMHRVRCGPSMLASAQCGRPARQLLCRRHAKHHASQVGGGKNFSPGPLDQPLEDLDLQPFSKGLVRYAAIVIGLWLWFYHCFTLLQIRAS